MAQTNSMTPLRIAFAGTPEFAVPALQALINSPHNLLAVYTQPDRPAGRGRKLTPSPVKRLAEKNNLPIIQPLNFKDALEIKKFADLDLDLFIVAAYGIILPKQILDTPKYGCLNIHASLLPRWRGAAPIHRAIEAGDAETGICIMQMDEGLDTGDVRLKLTIPINKTDTTGLLIKKLAELGADGLLMVINNLEKYPPIPQPNNNITYANKINKSESQIDWSESAEKIDQKIRAFSPFPIASSFYKNSVIKIHQAELIHQDHDYKPGQIIAINADNIHIACAKSSLKITQIQLPNKNKILIKDLFNAKPDFFELNSFFENS